MKPPTEQNPWIRQRDFDRAPAGYYLSSTGRMFQKLKLDPTDEFADECDWIELNFGTGTTGEDMARVGYRLFAMLVDPAELVAALRDCLTAIQAYRKKVILGDISKTPTFEIFTQLTKDHLNKINP